MARTCVVTGAAGFIGSHLTHRLLDDGWSVLGIDGFTDSYPVEEKLTRAAALTMRPGFTLVSGHLDKLDLPHHLAGAEVVFHLAGRAGVRSSFALQPTYHADNVTSTEALVAACRSVRSVRRMVYASSSSVYGNAPTPFREDAETHPVSPYGVSKLDAERICLGADGPVLETVALRYFTVYGPGQRPDMGLRIFAEHALRGSVITVFGDGRQSRDFTYVDDIVTATVNAAFAPVAGLAINVGGGSVVTLSKTLELLQSIVEAPLHITYQGPVRGDVRHTAADLHRAEHLLGFRPATSLHDGLANQVAWLAERMRAETLVPA